MADMALPQIVDSIRERMPELLQGSQPHELMPMPAAIAVVEAALWRAWWMNPNAPEIRWHGGSEPLSLIRALCHAIGVRLENTNG